MILERNKHKLRCRGFTLIEMIFVIAIIGLLAAIVVPNYMKYRYNGQIAHAISEINGIEKAITNYRLSKRELPDSLADINLDFLLDPWGRPYQYLRIDGNTDPGLKGQRRRDKNANPVNSDYDLFSLGQDGVTAAQFTSDEARDDVVRANDGLYIGLAKNH